MKKIFSVTMASVLVVSSLAVSASAAYLSGGSSCPTQSYSGSGATASGNVIVVSGSDLSDISQYLENSGCTLPEEVQDYLNSITQCDPSASWQTPAAPETEAPAQSEPEPAATPEPSATPTPAAPDTSDDQTSAPAEETETDTGTTADNLSFEAQVAELVNEYRAQYGLEPLTLSESLSNVARVKSQDMHDNNYFDHNSPTYGSPFEMLASFGISYSYAGENIAVGYVSPAAVVEAWMNSEGHRANILNANYTQIGVGYVADGSYWTQEFIG